MKKFFVIQKNIVFLVILITFFIGGFWAVNSCKAVDAARKGLNQSATQGYLGEASVDIPNDAEMMTDISISIGTIVGAGLSLLGIIFLLLIIYGGIIWMIARGNEQRVEQAKTTIEAAVIGLVIVLAAYAITYFIGQALAPPPTT